jgi:predicted TIM-barrel fold metal-dependent hydrolase
MGLSGIKLHCHVQCFSPDDEALEGIYDACARHGKPIVVHAGREPKSAAYKCDPHALCSAERTRRVLERHPRLTLVVPHLGADEYDAYLALLERYDNLWLDTTMVLADYFGARPSPLFFARPERILYGTDFPNLPYAWDRELVRLEAHGGEGARSARHLGREHAAFVRARALFRSIDLFQSEAAVRAGRITTSAPPTTA